MIEASSVFSMSTGREHQTIEWDHHYSLDIALALTDPAAPPAFKSTKSSTRYNRTNGKNGDCYFGAYKGKLRVTSPARLGAFGSGDATLLSSKWVRVG